MKKFNFVFIAFLLIACHKDELYQPERQITNPTDYILKKIINTSSTNGETSYFEYNGDKNISRITQCNWGTYSVNNGPWQKWYDTTIYTFEYSDGILSEMKQFESGIYRFRITYEYNHLKQVSKKTAIHSNNVVDRFYLYYYDQSGKLIKKEHCAPHVYFTEHFSYDNNNNLISHESFSKAGPDQTKYKTDWGGFDNKVNYLRSINGIHEWRHMTSHVLSPNNPLEHRYHATRNTSDTYSMPDNTVQYSYTYNTVGLPTQILSRGWVVDLEYEKYK